MLVRPRRTFEALSVSALDLFATALGVFVLIAIFLFPYYLNEPARHEAVAGATADLAAAGARLERVRVAADRAAADRAEAEAARRASAQRLATAEAALAEAERSAGDAPDRAEAARARARAIRAELARLHVSDLDLVFVVDSTGSMGDEIADLRTNLQGVIRLLQRLSPSLQIGLVAFKDYSDDTLTQAFSLIEMDAVNERRILGFVDELRASGGGDVPEPVDVALGVARAMAWRKDVRGRIVVIGDAPVRAANEGAALNLVSEFARSGGAAGLRRVSAIFTGNQAPGRGFYRRLASAGGGDFVAHRGRMTESILMSVLDPRRR